MTARRDADEALREAFQTLGDASAGKCSDADLERIWKAVAGELPASDRRELVDRMATDPAFAEAWRIADELWRASQTSSASPSEPQARWWAPSWIATAALVLLGVSLGLVSYLNRSPNTEFRNRPGYEVQSAVPSETAISRETFRLRWTPGPQGSRYQVRVTTEDLRVLATADGLTEPEFMVERDRLTTLPPGAKVLWQVDAVLPSGERISSPTFVARVQ